MNYAELVQQIQDYAENDETSFVSNIPNFVKQAEDRVLYTVQLPQFRKNVSGSISAGIEYLSLPSDFMSPFSLAVYGDDGEYTYLLNKDVNFIRQAYPSAATLGTPRYYALWDDDTALLGPTPNTLYNAELHYQYRPQSIVDSGTSWLGDNAPTALLYGSLVEAYTYMKGDADMMAEYQKEFDSAMVGLKVLGDGKDRGDAYRDGQVKVPVR